MFRYVFTVVREIPTCCAISVSSARLGTEFVDLVGALHTLLMVSIVQLDFAVGLAFVAGRKLLLFFHRKRL